MQIFQIAHLYEPYKLYLESKLGGRIRSLSYDDLMNYIRNDGFMSTHILDANRKAEVYFVIWDYKLLQEKWADENGIDYKDTLDILLAQIEQLKPDVVYNMSTQYIGYDFFERLTIKPILTCWNADAGRIQLNPDLVKYKVFYTSSVNALKKYENAALHYPAFDNGMLKYSGRIKVRDLYFYGQFTRGGLFDERNEYLIKLQRFLHKQGYSYRFALMMDIWKVPLINRRYVWRLKWLQKNYPGKEFIKNVSNPDFGSEMYKGIADSRIVFNASGGLLQFGKYRFNMRIFETLGVGSFMLSDEGIYPENLIPGKHFDTYKTIKELKDKIQYYLIHEKEREEIAKNGQKALRNYYSKEKQFLNFTKCLTTKGYCA